MAMWERTKQRKRQRSPREKDAINIPKSKHKPLKSARSVIINRSITLDWNMLWKSQTHDAKQLCHITNKLNAIWGIKLYKAFSSRHRAAQLAQAQNWPLFLESVPSLIWFYRIPNVWLRQWYYRKHGTLPHTLSPVWETICKIEKTGRDRRNVDRETDRRPRSNTIYAGFRQRYKEIWFLRRRHYN